MTLTDFLSRLEGVTGGPDQFSALCPAHPDNNPSLAVSEGADGRTLLYCHAGCSTEDVAAALGLTVKDLRAPRAVTRDRQAQGRDAPMTQVAAYDYVDEADNILYQRVRYVPKDFRVRRPGQDGGWIWNLGNVRRVLYRLPEVLRAIQAGRYVFLVEGEKDADALAEHGLVATTVGSSAEPWEDAYTACLEGAHVVIIPDNDKPGHKHASKVARAIHGTAATVQIVYLES